MQTTVLQAPPYLDHWTTALAWVLQGVTTHSHHRESAHDLVQFHPRFVPPKHFSLGTQGLRSVEIKNSFSSIPPQQVHIQDFHDVLIGDDLVRYGSRFLPQCPITLLWPGPTPTILDEIVKP